MKSIQYSIHQPFYIHHSTIKSVMRRPIWYFHFSLSGFIALYWLLLNLLCCKCMQCRCEGDFWAAVLVWRSLYRRPTWIPGHESEYIYLLPQSSPLAQCSTITTYMYTIDALGFVALYSGQRTVGVALWHVNLFLLDQERLEQGIFEQHERQVIYELSCSPLILGGDLDLLQIKDSLLAISVKK